MTVTGRTADATQSACILRRFVEGYSLAEVVATGRGEYGWARVREVLAEHGLVLNEQERLPADERRRVVAAQEVDALLLSAAGNADRRIAELAVHIRGDLSTLLQLLAADRDRHESARRVALAGERAERLLARHDQTHQHRRRTDGRVAS